ncbi:MAG: hypothetical protein AB8G14_10850 [Ilumatobacter sp.]
MSDTLALAREFMRAAEAGDIEAVRACFHSDAGKIRLIEEYLDPAPLAALAAQV